MAVSGTLNSSGYEGRYIQFTWSRASYSVANNTTTINWTLKGAGNASSTWYYAGNFAVSINGESVYSSATRIQLANGTVITSGTKTIKHNSDGSKSFTVSIAAGIYTYAVNCTGSTTFTLDSIPRASTPKVSATSVNLGDTITITTNRASTNFTHTISYKLGSDTLPYADGLAATSGITTSVELTPPLYLAQTHMPNTTSITANITLITYNGSTKIGEKSTTVTFKVPESIIPEITSLTFEEANTNVSSKGIGFLQHQSQLNITVNFNTQYGSNISSAWLGFEGQNYGYTGTNPRFTTSTINTSGNSIAVECTITDTRGRSSYYSTTIPVLPWVSPTCNQPSTQVDSGDLYLDIDYTYTPTFGEVNNTLYAVWRYKQDTQDWTEWITTDFSESATEPSGNYLLNVVPDYVDTSTYYFECKVQDIFSEGPIKTLVIGTPVLSLGKGGKNVTFFDQADTSREGIFINSANLYYREDPLATWESFTHTAFSELNNPIGSIYLSVDSTSPAAIFGGIWEQLKDTFLLGSGNLYTLGSLGGSATHKLTVAELPSHQHTIPNTNTGGYDYTWSSHTVDYVSGKGYTGNVNTAFVGGDTAHNNMPPYLVVNIWKRIG